MNKLFGYILLRIYYILLWIRNKYAKKYNEPLRQSFICAECGTVMIETNHSYKCPNCNWFIGKFS